MKFQVNSAASGAVQNYIKHLHNLSCSSHTVGDNVEFEITTPVTLKDGRKATLLGYKDFRKTVSFYNDHVLNDLPCRCDECQKEIARNAFYYFDIDGQTKCFGSTCAKKYLAENVHLSPSACEYMLADIEEAQDFASGTCKDIKPLDYVIQCVADVTEFKYWIKDGESRNAIRDYMNSPEKFHNAQHEKVDLAAVKQDLINCYKDFDAKNPSCFNSTVHSELFDDNGNLLNYVYKPDGYTFFGIFAAGKKVLCMDYSEGYIGQVGDEIQTKFQLHDARGIETQFGGTILYIGCDEKGHKITFFSTSSKFSDFKIGQWYTIKGTVKSQQKRNDMDETTIARPKLAKEAA